ncbi:arabinose transporter [Poseidonocella sp. HB161398]|uniref:arabinose transporter n=1 Tax=Poseidonocella sp. HB161398 TaxID=2320855 RepID=UPI0019811D91|nr:arabinose transporter [Poseidonocella sp. HB161398]
MTSPTIGAAVPVMGVVFVSFLVIGIGLPSLPLHVHQDLGFGPGIVGLIAGSQFCAALVSRLWAGNLADRLGAKRAVELGLILAVLGGLAYCVSLQSASPVLAALLLVLARALVGAAESLVITGGIAWGLGLVSAGEKGKAISWIGMSMFAAFAFGGPLGGFLYKQFGFWAIALPTLFVPGVVLLWVRGMPKVPPAGNRQRAALSVLRSVMLPGIAFSLSGVTFGAMVSFVVLYYAAQGWSGEIIAFSVFAAALILARLVAGGLPDRLGGARVALVCLMIQAAGLFIVVLSSGMMLATLGVALAGVGFSLVFPGLGLEAMRRAPEEQRGLAMGTYNAFLDLTLGLGSPLLGAAAHVFGLGAVFTIAGLGAVLAIPLVLRVLRASPGRTCR